MAAYKTLSIEEINLRAYDNNKTLICEVEKSYERRFKVRCLNCHNESIVLLSNLSYSKSCRKCYHLLKSKEQAILKAKDCNVELLSYVCKRSDNHHVWSVKCNNCNNVKDSIVRDFGGCQVCRANNQRYSKEVFIEKAKLIHADKFNYDFLEYINSITKVKIFCNVCKNFFLQTPGQHLYGNGCLNCSGNKKSNNEEFSKKAIEIHGNKYCYNLVDYINTDEKVKIKCFECDKVFFQTPHAHLSGQGCIICYHKNKSLSTDEFINKAKQIHGKKYSYDLVNYQHNKVPVDIKCNTCNFYFKQRPRNHLRGKGCPKCNESKGELYLKKILTENNIEFIPQHTFPGLKYINPLRCDIYIPNVNLVIEVDGDGHRKAIFGSTPEEKQKTLEDIVRNDAIKNKYCEDHEINICRIPYSISDKDLSFIGEIAMNCYNDLRIKYNINMLDFNNEENVNVL